MADSSSSTKLTIGAGPAFDRRAVDQPGSDETPRTMADSRALDLVFALARAHEALLQHVSNALQSRGYAGASPSTLAFLAQLDCGANMASDVARRLGQSRQMVAKTVKQLSELGYLEISRDSERGNQKVITFTAQGERLVAEARAILASLDDTLERDLDRSSLEDLVTKLGRIADAVA